MYMYVQVHVVQKRGVFKLYVHIHVYITMCSAFASHDDDVRDLRCNTAKDKEKLHHRTAGN